MADLQPFSVRGGSMLEVGGDVKVSERAAQVVGHAGPADEASPCDRCMSTG